MKTQLWMHAEAPDPTAVWVQASHASYFGPPKPDGGLWTSTWLGPEQGSDWVRFCRSDYGIRWLLRERAFLLEPRAEARLVTVDSMAGLRALVKRGRIAFQRNGEVDWQRLIDRGYDGLHLTERGFRETRNRLERPNLHSWDCESTVWFRWAFESWREVALDPVPGAKPLDLDEGPLLLPF